MIVDSSSLLCIALEYDTREQARKDYLDDNSSGITYSLEEKNEKTKKGEEKKTSKLS